MSQSLSPVPAAVCGRLHAFVPKLYFLADWVSAYGQRFEADGLKDCIPFVLRRLGQEVEEIGHDLEACTEADHV